MKTQKELKAIYRAELVKAWRTEKMVDYCAKKAGFIFEYAEGLYEVDKPSIETSFCFGYGYNGISTDGDSREAAKMSEYAKTSEQYFIAMNLRGIDRQISQLKNIAAEMRQNWAEGSHPRYMVETGAHYYGQPEDCRLKNFSVVDTFNGTPRGEVCEDANLVEMLIQAYERVREDFVKRLNSYLKRYGTSKVRSWTYLVD